MSDDVTRLVEAARALLQTNPFCTVEAPCRTCALRDALVPFSTPAPATCATIPGADPCERCGLGCMDPSWRWAADHWEHKCPMDPPQAGYFTMPRKAPAKCGKCKGTGRWCGTDCRREECDPCDECPACQPPAKCGTCGDAWDGLPGTCCPFCGCAAPDPAIPASRVRALIEGWEEKVAANANHLDPYYIAVEHVLDTMRCDLLREEERPAQETGGTNG